MKNTDQQFDNFLKDALNSHTMTPSDGAKRAFLKDASALPPVRTKHRGGLLLFSALSALAILGIVIWQVISTKTSPRPVFEKEHAEIQATRVHSKPLSPQKTEGTSNPAAAVANKPAIRETLKTSQATARSVSSQLPKPESKVVKNDNSTSTAKKSKQVSPESFSNTQQVSRQDDLAKETTSITDNLPLEVNTVSTLTTATPDIQNKVSEHSPETNDQQEVKPEDSVLLIPSVKSTKVHSGKFLPSLGLYYTPEWMFNTIEGEKFIHNFGIEGIFNYGPFSIRTGVGLTIGQGTNELVVEYNDFLGTYNKLDSMDFTWDDPTHQYLPSYYMSRQDVWDSLLKLDYPKVVKRYTYLQIPLIFGYEFWNSTSFSLGFRIGPQLSVLLGSRQISADYDPGKNRIIRINNISPGQVNLNWQVMGGLNLTARLNKVLKFEVEPFIKYYFNSVYEKPVNNAKPWSVGVRAAFNIELK